MATHPWPHTIPHGHTPAPYGQNGHPPAVAFLVPDAEPGAPGRRADILEQSEFAAHVVNAVAPDVARVAKPRGTETVVILGIKSLSLFIGDWGGEIL